MYCWKKVKIYIISIFILTPPYISLLNPLTTRKIMSPNLLKN